MAWQLPATARPWFNGANTARQPFVPAPRPQMPQIAGGGDPGMVLPTSGQYSVRNALGLGNSQPGTAGDGNDRGGQGFGANGASGNPGFSIQDILDAQAGVQKHGYGIGDLPKDQFNPRDMAIGAAVGQLPMGGTAASILGPIGQTIWDQKTGPYYAGATQSPASVAKGFASSLPGVGPLFGLSQWYAGTPRAQNTPVGSYYMGGNADQEAAKYADSAYRSGFGANQMQSLYDAIAGQKNLGGAGNVQGAIDAWRASNFNDGKIHIGEKGLENPYSFDMSPSTQIDNSGAGVTFAPQAGPDTGMPDASQSGGGNEPGGYIDMGDGSQTIDNSGIGVSGDGNGGIDWGYAKGGMVRKPMPGMMDPEGPDDQMAPLQSGEGVLTRAAMKKLGPAVLKALNAGQIDRKKLLAAVRKAG